MSRACIFAAKSREFRKHHKLRRLVVLMKMRIHVASTVGGGTSSQFESLNDEIKLTNTCGEVLEKVAQKIGIADSDSLRESFL